MKKIFLFLALSIALTGCSDDDDSTTRNTFRLTGSWTETDPTAGQHKINFINETKLSLNDDSEEGIVQDYTYTLNNDILTLTTAAGSSSTHQFERVNFNTIKITGLNFYIQPANEMPVVVTFVKD